VQRRFFSSSTSIAGALKAHVASVKLVHSKGARAGGSRALLEKELARKLSRVLCASVRVKQKNGPSALAKLVFNSTFRNKLCQRKSTLGGKKGHFASRSAAVS